MTASAISMVSASVYVGGHVNALAELANCLGVPPCNVFAHAQHGGDYSFYRRNENSIQYAAVNGDFFVACDVDLFYTTPGELKSKLQALSLQGITVALPNEASTSPFDYFIFENGVVRSAEVLQDDDTDTDTVTIWRAANA